MLTKRINTTYNMNRISMILSSCDKYEDLWYPFCYQLVANWPEFNMPIYLGTESKHFSFTGLDIRCPLSGGEIYRQWSERLLQLLKKIDDEYILFMLDDFWLTEKVDVAKFNRVFSYMRDNKNIGFICLLHEEKFFLKGEIRDKITASEYEDLNEWKKGLPFRITTQAGLWRKKYLIKLLRSHESAWYFETRATWRSKFYHERVFDVKRDIITYPIGGFLGGGKCYKDYIHYYPNEILDIPLKRGVISYGATKSYPKEARGILYYWNLLKSITPKW